MEEASSTPPPPLVKKKICLITVEGLFDIYLLYLYVCVCWGWGVERLKRGRDSPLGYSPACFIYNAAFIFPGMGLSLLGQNRTASKDKTVIKWCSLLFFTEDMISTNGKILLFKLFRPGLHVIWKMYLKEVNSVLYSVLTDSFSNSMDNQSSR